MDKCGVTDFSILFRKPALREAEKRVSWLCVNEAKENVDTT